MVLQCSDWRDTTLRCLVAFGVSVGLITEILGHFHLLRRTPLALVWGLVALGWAVMRARRGAFVRVAAKSGLGILDWLMTASVVLIGCITLATALGSPPNSSDAMSYHMPRVVYWAQAGSVSFFPTPYYAQIMLQPLAEYFALHTYVISGSDRFVNLVQWLGSIGCAVGVTLVAKMLGAELRGQVVAGLFCATLPNGILQASGAKNDYLLALWLVAMAYFALRYAQWGERSDVLGLSAAVGLALMTKGTAYLYVWSCGSGWNISSRPPGRAPAIAAGDRGGCGRGAAAERSSVLAQFRAERVAARIRLGSGRRFFPLAK